MLNYQQEIKEMKKELRDIRADAKQSSIRLTSCMNRQSDPYAARMSKRIFELKLLIETYTRVLEKNKQGI